MFIETFMFIEMPYKITQIVGFVSAHDTLKCFLCTHLKLVNQYMNT